MSTQRTTTISVTSLLAVLLTLSTVLGLVMPTVASASQDTTDKSIPGWRDMKFGLFVHWGPVSLKGTEIGWSRGSQVPAEEYDRLYKQFNPTEFDAEEWVKVAKETGMKYLVLTSKHHDGFCLWPSKYTDYHIGNTPFKRDVMKELSEACKKHGIQFCTYHSVCDWRHPDYPLGSPGGSTSKSNPNMPRYYEYLKNQTKEIIDNYGPLGIMWFDGEWEKPWTQEYGNELYDYLKKIQPTLVINNRVSKGRHGMAGTTKQSDLNAGDYDTPEQRVGGFNRQRPWETCMTICQQWAWKPNDRMKSAKECIQTLLQTVGGDGNLLFNVGPMPDGRIEPRQVERLKEMGAWLKQYGTGIYGTRGGPFKPGKWGASTCKGDKIWLYIMNWHSADKLVLPPIGNRIRGSQAMSGGMAVVTQQPYGIEIELPQAEQDPIATVIALKIAGPALEIEPLDVPDEPAYLHAQPKLIRQWQDKRFGMFVHWGPVSLKGTEIGWSRQGPRRGRARAGTGTIPMAEYDNLYKSFDPVRFDADEWIQIAQEAGMKYLVFTSKHHDGFSMFDTKQTDYKITSEDSPYGKDICAQLADACHRHGLSLGWYYSPRDWYHADFATEHHEKYLKFYMNQLRELATNYGKLDILWFDGLDSPRQLWGNIPEESFKMLRGLQPDILLNNRGGLPGDCDTPEQRVGGFNRKRPWETCMTICRQWAWKPNDTMKSKKQCIQTLISTAGGDGNLLFNVGPMPDGRIEPRQVERLKEMGAWLREFGNGIYGTRGGPFKPSHWGASTCKDNAIYVYVMNWPEDGPMKLPAIKAKIVSADALNAKDLDIDQTETGLVLDVPVGQRDGIATVIVLTVDTEAFDIPPVAVANVSGSLTFGKQASVSNVFQKSSHYGPGMALDDNPETRWATDAGTHTAWLAVDLGRPETFSRVAISEAYDRVRRFELQYKTGQTWKPFARGTTLGEKYAAQFDPVTAQHVRLNILEATEGPTLWEFQLLPPQKEQ
jgi:alpha-L-fucosidase